DRTWKLKGSRPPKMRAGDTRASSAATIRFLRERHDAPLRRSTGPIARRHYMVPAVREPATSGTRADQTFFRLPTGSQAGGIMGLPLANGRYGQQALGAGGHRWLSCFVRFSHYAVVTSEAGYHSAGHEITDVFISLGSSPGSVGVLRQRPGQVNE